jgi:flagellar hook-length control protein FliK
MQILDAAIRATTKPVDLVFDPKELGVVRISMTMADGAVNLTILAERQDTLDLARRHADQLAVELRDLGYGTVNFTFGQQGQFQENNQTDADPLGSREQIEPAQPPISKPIRTVGPHDATLDIRV